MQSQQEEYKEHTLDQKVGQSQCVTPIVPATQDVGAGQLTECGCSRPAQQHSKSLSINKWRIIFMKI